MIMNKKKQLFGVIEEVEENTNYTGKQTETATVTVNNVDRTISVDVSYTGMLGQTADKAYPGHLGADTRNLVGKAFDTIQEETERAKEAESEIADNVADVSWKLRVTEAQVNKQLQQLAGSLDEEVTRATADTSELRSEVAELSTSFSDGLKELELELQENTVVLDNKINQTIEDLTDNITDVSDKLEAETRRAVTAEQQLSEDVTSLHTQNQAEHKDINQQLNRVETKLSDEVKRATSEELKLSNNLNSLGQKTSSQYEHLNQRIDATSKSFNDNLTTSTKILSTSIQSVKEDLEDNYATKEDVYNVLKLSKQLVENVDVNNNSVIINGVSVAAIDGVIYLLKLDSTTVSGDDIYQEYTTINNKLTLIGDTSVDLTGYATEKFVQAKIDEIPEVDLTPYAKHTDLPTKVTQLENDADYATRSEIPDVSSFIAEIPEEYITESELAEQNLTTMQQVSTLLSNIEFIDGGTSASIKI